MPSGALPSIPEPPEIFSAHLRRLRAEGVSSFDAAWSTAWRAYHWLRFKKPARDEWKAVMEATRPAWRAAFLGLDPHIGEAFTQLAEAPPLTPEEGRELPPERTHAEVSELRVEHGGEAYFRKRPTPAV